MITVRKNKAYLCQIRGVSVFASLLFVLLVSFPSIGHQDTVCGSPHSGPIDNPILHHYASYTWTDNFQWSCVYNILDFEGDSDQERFSIAQNEASQRGGGIIYFPAGQYEFNEDLVLKQGIVIRGESPSFRDAKEHHYSPQSKLIFPQYHPTKLNAGTSDDTAFKRIKSMNPDSDSFIGLVDLDINRATISFGDDIDKAQSSNIIIYGIRQNNAASPNRYVPNPEFQSPWLRFSDLLEANIKIIAKSNVLIANNRLNDEITDTFEQANYQVRHDDGSVEILSEGWKVPFSYTNHYGISVNRFKEGTILFNLAADPAREPGLFRKGIVIQDNWVYHTMSAGIHASGDGLIIRNNISAMKSISIGIPIGKG